MKLSKSKLALAKVINENGGWPERALWAVQDNCIAFFLGGKPEYKSGDRCWYSNSIDGACVGTITCDEEVTNWHQTILSREEYYQAYPKADADEWIEWKGGMKSPVESGVPVDVKTKDGYVHYDQLLGDACWRDNWGDANIISYRLHKPYVKPEPCESVTRGIPEPEANGAQSRLDDALAIVKAAAPHLLSDKYKFYGDEIMGERKPTIEQLAQDYRNKLDYADRKQQEADEAKAAADAALGELERAGEALGLLIGIVKPEPELAITDWRDLRVGDEIECVGYGHPHTIGVVEMFDEISVDQNISVRHQNGDASWPRLWKFIRRP